VKRDDTIVTLTGNIDSSIAIIGDLQAEVKEKNDGLLKKSNAITKLNKSNAMKEHKVKELEALLVSREAALQQKIDDLATADTSSSKKDKTIEQLQAQIIARDKKITKLEYKLSCDIAKGLKSGRSHTGKPIDRKQDCGPQANAFRQPRKEASINGSAIALKGATPQYPRTYGEIDSQLRDNDIRVWLSDVREPGEPICPSEYDLLFLHKQETGRRRDT
jgi:hypothetical protein